MTLFDQLDDEFHEPPLVGSQLPFGTVAIVTVKGVVAPFQIDSAGAAEISIADRQAREELIGKVTIIAAVDRSQHLNRPVGLPSTESGIAISNPVVTAFAALGVRGGAGVAVHTRRVVLLTPDHHPAGKRGISNSAGQTDLPDIPTAVGDQIKLVNIKRVIIVVPIERECWIKARWEGQTIGARKRTVRCFQDVLSTSAAIGNEDVKVVRRAAAFLDIAGEKQIQRRALNSCVGGIEFRALRACAVTGRAVTEPAVDGLRRQRAAVDSRIQSAVDNRGSRVARPAQTCQRSSDRPRTLKVAWNACS